MPHRSPPHTHLPSSARLGARTGGDPHSIATLRVRACDGCGTLAYPDDLYCSCCGAQLWTQRHCRHCSAPIRHPLAIHCTHCGEMLEERSGEEGE